MSKRIVLAVGAAAGIVASAALAQGMIMDMVANKVIQKYQGMTCEQLWQQKGQPKSAEEQRVIGLLQGDPQLRQQFINQIAGPVVNKMFDCGLVP